MKRLLIGLVVLMLAAGVANAARVTDDPGDVTDRAPAPDSRLTTFFFDDCESGNIGWTTVDNTAAYPIRFHIDSYMRYAGNYSWWCGTFEYDANGGYGANWFEFLTLPATDVSAADYPVLSFAMRCDSEQGYDFTYIQVKEAGDWADQGAPWDGRRPWFLTHSTPYYLGYADNPVEARFLFVSDSYWSDDQGDDTIGGACAFDDIKIWDFFGTDVYFYDDVESGGLCTPGNMANAGNYWQLVLDNCSSYPDPMDPERYSWQCIDLADTTKLPALINNSLYSPWVDISQAETCLLSLAFHSQLAGAGGYCTGGTWGLYVTYDGTTEFRLWPYGCGDIPYCDRFYTFGFTGVELSTAGFGWPQSQVQFRCHVVVPDTGTHPTAAGACCVVIDNFTLAGEEIQSPVHERSWGGIKSLYR